MRNSKLQTLKRTSITALLSGILFIASCAPFGHLTRVNPENDKGPQASQCGACHIDQYQEWQGTAHARAFTSKTFQKAAGSPAEEECLKCHTPLGIPEKKPEARSFHQEEGVTCVSCHFSQGKMVGPHATSGLFDPHPAKVDAPFFQSTTLCATCHDETHAQWQKAGARQQIRSCQECHMPAVQRRATRGDNPFSIILVSFEKKIEARSHEITLDWMAHFPGAVTISVLALSQGTPALAVNISNHLPHDLPTGTFGEKEIQLRLVFLHEGIQVAENKVVVSDAQHPLTAGDSKKLVLPLSSAAIHADTLRLDLERHSEAHAGRPPIVLSSKIFDSVSAAFH